MTIFAPAGQNSTIYLGPFLSNSDFKTPVTNLTSSSGNLLLAQGGVSGDVSGRAFTHLAAGVYSIALLGSDIATPNCGKITGNFASAVPISDDIMVVTPNFWAALSGVAFFGVNVLAINGSSDAAVNLSKGALATVPFVVQSGSSNTVVNTNLPSTTNANYNGRSVLFFTGALTGQGCSITGYNGSTNQLTVTALTGAPAPGDLAVVI